MRKSQRAPAPNADAFDRAAFFAGGRRLFREYLHSDPNKRILLVIDPAVEETAARLVSVGEGEDLRITTVHSNAAFHELEELFRHYEVITFLERNTSHYRRELNEYISKQRDQTRSFYRVFDLSPELITSCFRVPREHLMRLNRRLIDKARESATVTIRTNGGTDLTIQLDSRFGWINSYGEFDGMHPGILPPSEVATFSSQVDGVLIADGAINTNFGFPFDPRLSANPVEIEFCDSRVVNMSCEAPLVALVLRKFLQVTNADRVGEVGFGTNIGLSNFVPFVSHINERFPALHIGLGSNNQGLSRVPWSCGLHLDLILGPCDIYFDDTTIMCNGRYVLAENAGANAVEPISDSTALVDTF